MKVFTVGYGGRPPEDFLGLLRDNGIEAVVDVRSNPYSSLKDYNRERLADRLARAGIGYVYMGEELGGLRERPYPEHMETGQFKGGISTLVDMAKEKRTAIMCAEKDPASCHRRHIADHLASLDIEVVHIMEDTSVQGRLL